MSENIENNEPIQNNDDGAINTESPEFKALIEARIASELAKIKENLDKSYSARDAAIKEAAELKEKLKREEIKALEKEGKTAEALQMKLADIQAKLEATQEENLRLSRDQLVKDALSGIKFKNNKARGVAFDEIRNALVRDEDGQWVHKTGASLKTAVESFEKDPDNEYLFDIPVSQGTTTPGLTKNKRPDSISNLSGAEIMELAKKNLL